MTGTGDFAGWEAALAEGVLRFPRCDRCGRWNWYPLPRCRNCGSADATWALVAPAGTLYSWTRVHRNFGGAAVAPLPYITGIIDIDEAPGVRLVCLNTQIGKHPMIGAPVILQLDRGPAGSRWKFELIS